MACFHMRDSLFEHLTRLWPSADRPSSGEPADHVQRKVPPDVCSVRRPKACPTHSGLRRVCGGREGLV